MGTKINGRTVPKFNDNLESIQTQKEKNYCKMKMDRVTEECKSQRGEGEVPSESLNTGRLNWIMVEGKEKKGK